MILERKDILGLKDITVEEIEGILSTAELMKNLLSQKTKKAPHLNGKSIVILFYENSTRTKVSFDLAAKYLSASTSAISASSSSIKKGETLIDTGRTIDAMGTDVIVIRHPMSGAAHLLAKNVKASVINAGDGINEHPTQALLDMFTIKEKKGGIKGLKVTIIGDILHSRVARSNIWGLKKAGADINIAAPATLIPDYIEDMGVNVFYDVRKAIKDADVVMGLRIQKERQSGGLLSSLNEYHRCFGINEELLSLAKTDALIMHPGPVNRGVEMSTAVVDGDNSVIDEQVANGVAIRMALLFMLTRRGLKG